MGLEESDRAYGLGERSGRAPVQAPAFPYQPRKTRSYQPIIAVVGCGGIASQHLQAYRNAGYCIGALCDQDRQAAVRARDAYFPDAAVCTDYRDVLAMKEIEVVDFATHPEVRYPMMQDGVQAGKHILSQKPFVLDLDEGEKLVDLADARGVRIAVNQNGRWAPHFSYMRHGIDAGLIGEVASVHLSVSWNHNWIAGTHYEDIHNLVLFDFGIHWFDIMTVFMRGKKVKEVYALAEPFPDQTVRPPLLAEVLVSYQGGVGSITFDADTLFGEEDRSVVIGRNGTLRSYGPDLNDQEVVVFTDQGMAVREFEGHWFPDGFHGSMAELLCAVEENREPDNSARDNLDSLALCFAALESAATGMPVDPGAKRQISV